MRGENMTETAERTRALQEEMQRKQEETSERFQAHLERLMEERGIESLKELHRRFVGTGYAYIPVPGLHRDKPVSFRLFSRIAAHQTPYIHPQFLRGLEEVLGLTEEELKELIWVYVWGEPLPAELRKA